MRLKSCAPSSRTRACGRMAVADSVAESSEETLLTPDDTESVYLDLFPARNRSYYLALNLRLPKDVVEDIHVAHKKPGHRLRRVVEEVLSRGSSATWRDIVDALRHPEVNMSPLANTIEARFPDPEQPIPESPSG